MANKSNRGYRTVKVSLAKTDLTIRGSRKLVKAVEDLTKEMSLYSGVKFSQILEAVYEQGKKDGARHAFEETVRALDTAKKTVPHRNPGRPTK